MPLKQKLYCQTLACKMGFTLKGILRLLDDQFSKENIDLTLEQYFLLNILSNEEGLIIQDLSEILDRDKSAITRHINGLEENNFVIRTPDPEDRRRKILLVTQTGMQELDRAQALDKQIQDSITRHISDNKLEELEDILFDMYERTTEELD